MDTLDSDGCLYGETPTAMDRSSTTFSVILTGLDDTSSTTFNVIPTGCVDICGNILESGGIWYGETHTVMNRVPQSSEAR